MKLILATNNNEKSREMQTILSNLGVKVLTARDIGVSLDDIEETGKTFEENARIKAHAVMKKSGFPAIADDSGLIVDALNGEPGIYSARYAGPGASDQKKIEKLLSRLNELNSTNRQAHFVCAICLVYPNGQEIFVTEKCYGKIALSPKGKSGFGYDPIFITESGKTFAELPREEKDKISHRGKALSKLAEVFPNFNKN
ncbi:MAG: XTP/dITP diphosphatase [Oscillospiraceae bacterium]|nr:XTP/dITP diphosphatase [Oscillospiraceae bacterium]